MFKNLVSKLGFGELPSSFGFTIGEKVDLPFQWHWQLHKAQKKSDGSAASCWICPKKDLDPYQVSASKNAEQMSKQLRHPNILRALESIEVDGGFYLVTEVATPLVALDGEIDKEPAVWGLYQALDALGFLHSSGFVHGLFGPASIFVTPQGDYRLFCFDLVKKGGDNALFLSGRRRSGPSVMGWPDPPEQLKDSGSPTVGIDLWGAALLMLYVFGTAKEGRRGMDFRINMGSTQDMPPEIRKPFADLRLPGPLKGRSPIADLLQLNFFAQHPAIRIMNFLANIALRSPQEKDAFFESLPTMLDSVPQSMATKQVLPELLKAKDFAGQEAASVLPSILKIGVKLKDDEFKEKVAPLVVQLFASPDRAIRFRLLTSIGDMIDHLDESMINDKIFPECVNGFTDSNAPIREATLKASVHFVPRLRTKTVEGRVVKLLVKLVSDPEPSIRTNAVICCGRLSGHLPAACANQTLSTVLTTGIKDSFPHCRSASLHTLVATASIFSAEDVATKLLPHVCHRLVDPDPTVCDNAYNALNQLQQHLRQQVEERRAQTMETSQLGQDMQKDASQQQGGGGWGSWAFSQATSVTSFAGSKLMGSMGRKDSDVGQGIGETTPSANAGAAAAVSSGGARSFSSSSKPAAAASAAIDADFAEPGGEAADAWGGDGEDFWDEFGGDKGGGDIVASGLAEKEPVKPPTPAKGMSLTSNKLAGGAASKAAAKAKPAVSSAQLSSKEDEDFWKEFDM